MVPGGGGLKSSQSVQDDQYDVSPMVRGLKLTDRLTELSCVALRSVEAPWASLPGASLDPLYSGQRCRVPPLVTKNSI